MNYDPALLDELARVFAEAALRRLDTPATKTWEPPAIDCPRKVSELTLTNERDKRSNDVNRV